MSNTTDHEVDQPKKAAFPNLGYEIFSVYKKRSASGQTTGRDWVSKGVGFRESPREIIIDVHPTQELKYGFELLPGADVEGRDNLDWPFCKVEIFKLNRRRMPFKIGEGWPRSGKMGGYKCKLQHAGHKDVSGTLIIKLTDIRAKDFSKERDEAPAADQYIPINEDYANSPEEAAHRLEASMAANS